MKLKDMGFLYSVTGNVQIAVLWSFRNCEDVASGSVDYLKKSFGDAEIHRIQAMDGKLVLTTD